MTAETAAGGVAPSAPEQDAALDALIRAAVTPEWIKVAVLIARVTDAARAAGILAGPPVIAARIYALAEKGDLSVQGNIRRWRAAVVRRGGSSAANPQAST